MILNQGGKKYYSKYSILKDPIFVTKNEGKRENSKIYDIQSSFVVLINDASKDTIIVSINIKNIARDEHFRIDD